MWFEVYGGALRLRDGGFLIGTLVFFVYPMFSRCPTVEYRVEPDRFEQKIIDTDFGFEG